MAAHEKKQKKEKIEETTRKFMMLTDDERSYIMGYMAGTAEERQRWEHKQAAVTA